jgi:HK97 family phage portal protein
MLDKIAQGRQPGGQMYGTYAQSDAGIMVSEDAAMRLAAVQACVRVLSEDIAALPLQVFMRTKDGGKERARSHPLSFLLHDEPNREMTAMSFKQAMMVNLLLGGNAYAFIEYDWTGRVIALWPLLHTDVTPFRDVDGEVKFRVLGESTPFTRFEILHIPGLSYDGLLGLSPIAYAREAIGLGMAAESFGARFFKDGTHLGGVISVPGAPMSDPAFERTEKQFREMYSGLKRSHGVAILEQGATYQALGISPEEAQFLETRKFQRSEIAAMYRVPLHLINDLDRATFSNIEHQDLGYLQRSLLPWMLRFEQGFMRGLMTATERRRFFIEHETGSFLRGDTKSRYEAYSLGINAGILTPNEARAKENMNPIEGGDEMRLPLNVTTPGAAGAAGKAKPDEPDARMDPLLSAVSGALPETT